LNDVNGKEDTATEAQRRKREMKMKDRKKILAGTFLKSSFIYFSVLAPALSLSKGGKIISHGK
jgi:hypothetical protein